MFSFYIKIYFYMMKNKDNESPGFLPIVTQPSICLRIIIDHYKPCTSLISWKLNIIKFHAELWKCKSYEGIFADGQDKTPGTHSIFAFFYTKNESTFRKTLVTLFVKTAYHIDWFYGFIIVIYVFERRYFFAFSLNYFWNNM